MNKIYILVSVLFIAFGSSAQTEDQPVKDVINTYFDGYTKGDSTILKEAFHPAFHLSWVDPWRNAFNQVDREGMFKFFGPKWSEMSITSAIDEVMMSTNAATAIATVALEGIVVWTDYLSLLKIEDRWWIVAKISEGEKIPRN